ncbi:MAG: synthase [Miltoncostaeaceae bacterium]|nr:synthase [Miltoncostaeaceae bacterium]
MSDGAVSYIFVTGGVVSSLGKGITAASLGTLLKARGLRVSLQKCDPYLNVDPGTMSPFQHGEVFVTEDGAETDLDLGHYERFTDESLTRIANVTTGSVYDTIIKRERRGDFLGATVQVIPHVTDEIKARIRQAAASSGADVVIVEIGGTVGDIESLPFLEAIRQFRNDVGRENVVFVHVTLVPYLDAVGELKSKTTQHSVNELRRIGIEPDILVLRSNRPLTDDIRQKIALYGGIAPDAVISAVDARDIYEVPLGLEDEGMARVVCRRLGRHTPTPDLTDWRRLVQRIHDSEGSVRIALVGKYVQLHDAYLSVAEALKHAAIHHGVELEIDWVDAEEPDLHRALGLADGILIPGGFGERGVEGKIAAARYARENNVPFLGICLGMQLAVVEFARNVVGMAGANSSEFDQGTPYPVIDLLPEQRQIEERGGTMRLGADPVALIENTKVRAAYDDQPVVYERHRHRYEVNPALRRRLEDAGLVASGQSPNGRLVEAIELPGHPWFCASQFHPEFKSRPTRPQPLYRDFVGAAVAFAGRGVPAEEAPLAEDDAEARTPVASATPGRD